MMGGFLQLESDPALKSWHFNLEPVLGNNGP